MPSRSAPTATTWAPYAGSAAGVEQRLQVAAGAGDEHDEPNGHRETLPTGSALLSAGLCDICWRNGASCRCSTVLPLRRFDPDQYAAEFRIPLGTTLMRTRAPRCPQPRSHRNGYPPPGQDPYGQQPTRTRRSAPQYGQQPQYGQPQQPDLRAAAAAAYQDPYAQPQQPALQDPYAQQPPVSGTPYPTSGGGYARPPAARTRPQAYGQHARLPARRLRRSRSSRTRSAWSR